MLGRAAENQPPQAFLTLPTSCSGPARLHGQRRLLAAAGRLGERHRAQPRRRRQPGGPRPLRPAQLPDHLLLRPDLQPRLARRPAIDFNLTQNQEGLTEPGGLAGSQVQKAVVSLPEGFTINPSLGAGLGVCTPAQFAARDADLEARGGLPQQLQDRRLHRAEPAPGRRNDELRRADQRLDLPRPALPQNPFDSLIGLYLVARAENGDLRQGRGPTSSPTPKPARSPRSSKACPSSPTPT